MPAYVDFIAEIYLMVNLVCAAINGHTCLGQFCGPSDQTAIETKGISLT